MKRVYNHRRFPGECMYKRRNTPPLFFLPFLLCAILLLTAWQSPAPTGPELPAPTIRVSTHMVLLDVVVTDKQGKAVNGLKPEDFTVEENGKTQKIAAFVSPSENKFPEPAALPPGIYSNKLQYRSPGAAITVMLLDALNTAYSDQAYARGQMLKFLQEQYRPGQRMAVFALTGPLWVLQDFTSDPQVLYTALQRYKPELQKFGTAPTSGSGPAAVTMTAAANASVAGPDANVDSGLGGNGGGGSGELIAQAQSAIAHFNAIEIAYGNDQRAVLTLAALNSLARILGGMPGRKNVIWVTGNIPFSLIMENQTVTNAELAEDLPSLNTRRVEQHAAGNYAATFREAHLDEIRDTECRLSSAQIALYPVDARGLSVSTSIDSQEIMRDVARETGGRAYVNQNEIRFGVQRAFDDLNATYTLGYYPENKKYDGKYRAVKVKVKQSGVDVQAREGYYAVEPTREKHYNPDQVVAAALQDTIPDTQVTFSARVLGPSENKSAPGKIGVDYLVDATTLSTEDANGGKRFNIDFYATVFANGKMMAEHSMKIDKTFDAATYQQIVQHGLLTHVDVDAPAGGKRLHLAVRDNQSGLVGTLSAPMP